MFSQGMFVSRKIGRVSRMASLVSAWCLTLACLHNAVGQAASSVAATGMTAQIIFQMDFPGQVTPHYKITLAEDGRGTYEAGAEEGEARQPVAFSIGAKDAAAWFLLARDLKYFRGEFAANRKVAFTGTKSFRYVGADTDGQTSFIYTENKKLEELTSHAQALALTLQLGQALLSDRRFNRMAVDRDMVGLKEALRSHTAAYPQAIAPVLAVLVDDEKVVAPVRRDASAILQAVGTVN